MIDPIILVLTNRRKQANLSRAQVAEIAGMSLKTYQRIERGESDMKLSQFRAIIRAMNLTELDVALDIKGVQQVTANDLVSACRLLNGDAQASLMRFLLLVGKNKL
ncbi:hypothetical protein VII00023_06232 [Vibrio ichthyoenteri ATCC 700023]|uniref:HTH cro/C1-type domain-containing protein n=1 Tax=Vibrio ichthyoenteri ATCC 700023 TaxID=870968 RepID=F9RXI7_9VIBR|nr:helix-turn-helix transcriptional regulator [Vibrio ichthyoenteri]EGU47911.1 hypothetical protein VII00023_06232 [Vibrio ichthyoenteri ATCC 700023]